MRISDWSSDVCSSDLKALGPSALAVIHVPIERGRKDESLRVLQTHGLDVGDERQKRGELLLSGDAELRRLLHGIRGIGTGVRKSDYIRAGCLRLEQLRGEIGSVQRRFGTAENLDRKTGDVGKSVSVRVELGGGR